MRKAFIQLIALTALIYTARAQETKPLWNNAEFAIYPDRVVQGKFTATALSDKEMSSDYKSSIKADPNAPAHWQLTKDITAFPQYHSGMPLSDALYNLSLEEMIKAVEPDSTFRTGKEWAGVWTRDISYSIILSMASLQPKVAMNSLLKKVNKKKKIIQDTGTGGAWPVSTDRMIWAVAAWELYKVTGDKNWLQDAYTVISNSLEDDYANAYDRATGLVHGESSFLDWREQTYPSWMQPADIYESESLGTNAVHYEANIIAAKMAALLNQKPQAVMYLHTAQKIREGINKYLWIPGKGFYAQYLYGRVSKVISPRSEALGEALSVLFDIADASTQQQIIWNVPVNNYGIPCIYPQIPGIPPYHNNAVWPFVQTYWLWAAAKTGNETSVLESIADIYRPAAMFLTNKENFVADNGDYAGTQINSSNMLWSLSGNLSIVHKVLFGIRFNEDSLVFKPFVPECFNGNRSLSNFIYRDAVLDIEMQGSGNKIKSFLVDGKPMTNPGLPASITGRHHIKIVLQDNAFPRGISNQATDYTSLPAPVASFKNGTLLWAPVKGAVKYNVLKNGKVFRSQPGTGIKIVADGFDEYSVIAIDAKSIPSFTGEPVEVVADNAVQTYEVESFAAAATGFDYKGFSGAGFTEISTEKNTVINIPITITAASNYIIDCRYSNGNGPVNTENKCAIRTVKINGKAAGVFVFPQRGVDAWSNWGMSNPLKCSLSPGKYNLSIEYLPANENMNGDINQAMLDYIRIIKAGK